MPKPPGPLLAVAVANKQEAAEAEATAAAATVYRHLGPAPLPDGWCGDMRCSNRSRRRSTRAAQRRPAVRLHERHRRRCRRRLLAGRRLRQSDAWVGEALRAARSAPPPASASATTSASPRALLETRRVLCASLDVCLRRGALRAPARRRGKPAPTLGHVARVCALCAESAGEAIALLAPAVPARALLYVLSAHPPRSWQPPT